jgi:hypothetical protein
MLARHPEMIHLRVHLAQIIAARAGAVGPDWEEAIGLLTPLANTHSDDVEMRTLALGMATTLRHGLGHDAEYHHLLQRFDQLAQAIQSPVGKEMVSEVRRLLPQVFPKPGSNGTAPPPKSGNHLTGLDPSALCVVIEQFGPLLAGAA